MSFGFLIWWAAGVIATGMIIREENDVKIWHVPIAVLLGILGPMVFVAYLCLYRIDFSKVLFKKRKVENGVETTSK